MKEVFISTWANGAQIKVVIYDSPLVDEDPSDRIQIIIKPADGDERGWIMNVADAVDIIYGLSKACSQLIENDVQLKPTNPL